MARHSADPDPTTHRIRIGPAGWSYKDWEGPVYPPHGSRFDPLGYLSSYFDTIEVNSSFYRVPPPTHGRSWVRRVASNPDFSFAIKLFRGFTHDRNATSADTGAFQRFLEPLADAGRLGALLVQFPWSFKDSPENREILESVLTRFSGYPRVAEFRHSSFQTEEIFALLESLDTGFANIDQPLFSDSVRPSVIGTGKVAYVRLHGRNYQKWFTHEESWERYNYLYSREELGPWAERARELAERRETFVITNNHFRGQAVANALELREMVGQPVHVPETVIEAYPERFGKK